MPSKQKKNRVGPYGSHRVNSAGSVSVRTSNQIWPVPAPEKYVKKFTGKTVIRKSCFDYMSNMLLVLASCQECQAIFLIDFNRPT